MVPGLDLPLLITPTFSVDIGVSVTAQASVQLQSSVSVTTGMPMICRKVYLYSDRSKRIRVLELIRGLLRAV